MIIGFDFLEFQAIKRFPSKNRIFLHVGRIPSPKKSLRKRFLLPPPRALISFNIKL